MNNAKFKKTGAKRNSGNATRLKMMCCIYVFAFFVLCAPRPAEAFLFTRSFTDDFGSTIGRPLDCASVVFWNHCFDPDIHKRKKYKRNKYKKAYRPLTKKEVRAAVRQYRLSLKKPRRTIRDPRIGRYGR